MRIAGWPGTVRAGPRAPVPLPTRAAPTIAQTQCLPHTPWKSSGGVATVPAASLFAFLPSQTACQRSGRPVRTAPGWPRPNHPSTRAHCTDPLSLLSPLPHHAGTPLPTPCQPPLSRQANVSLAWEGRRRGGGGGAWGVRVEREEKRQENRRSFFLPASPPFFFGVSSLVRASPLLPLPRRPLLHPIF